MKKLIIVSVLLCSILFVPVFVSAQAAPTSAQLTQQLIQTLTQLIAQLEQQIKTILAQQKSQAVDSSQIAQSTSPATTTTTIPALTVTPVPTPTPTPTPLIQCNGISYNPCLNGKESYCPPSGTMICYNPGDIFCNNQYWTPCPSGQTASCSSTGEICQIPTPITTLTPVCNPNWQCGTWNTCTNSLQTRTCTDSNGCNTTNGKPNLMQACIMPVPTLTPAQQTQACQNTYNTASSSLSANEQQTENQLNSQISSTQSQLSAIEEQFAGNGTASSGAAARAEQPYIQNIANEKAQLANAQAQYQTNSTALNNTLQTCLSSVVQVP
jgi:hypothetical protein